MNFAKWVFRIAGIWGLLAVPPLYFLYDTIGRMTPPAITHPEFYYGFLGVTVAWQVAFLVIGSDPARYRPLMIPSILEKAAYVAAMAVLCAQERVQGSQMAFALGDALLGALFLVAFLRTRPVSAA